ncbi:MAG TPA: DUF421 domain-containing protein [Thermomonas sp.]|jgi:uncharacterized membrane protein YcaP (DUF421 family)|uniref:DUF421 domain-containing protein n=1 Tax=Thermomonas sp. TaxID=1971895 RepID=UPI002CE45C7E|nr:DUF421 domain-containing protein [Thermomonas sp.]HOZ23596.1 DUF421 domain-containing protein [Thermomonas sp.]HPM57338.1 DUF421 domain-containing protein [Thermomonas sp.]HPW13139.1 DUF421 domain-containing protein [Thermomonas sp.]
METDFVPFDWFRIFVGEQPPAYLLEVALKCLLVFCLLLLVMRLSGKRAQNSLSPMQQMLLIALGSAAGDVLLYPSVALSYAALVLVGITLLTVGFEAWSQRSRRVGDFAESRPTVMVEDGVIDHEALRRERTTLRELNAELRVAGARSLSQVRYAILEMTGEFSVFLNDEEPAGEDLLIDAIRLQRGKPTRQAGG